MNSSGQQSSKSLLRSLVVIKIAQTRTCFLISSFSLDPRSMECKSKQFSKKEKFEFFQLMRTGLFTFFSFQVEDL